VRKVTGVFGLTIVLWLGPDSCVHKHVVMEPFVSNATPLRAALLHPSGIMASAPALTKGSLLGCGRIGERGNSWLSFLQDKKMRTMKNKTAIPGFKCDFIFS